MANLTEVQQHIALLTVSPADVRRVAAATASLCRSQTCWGGMLSQDERAVAFLGDLLDQADATLRPLQRGKQQAEVSSEPREKLLHTLVLLLERCYGPTAAAAPRQVLRAPSPPSSRRP